MGGGGCLSSSSLRAAFQYHSFCFVCFASFTFQLNSLESYCFNILFALCLEKYLCKNIETKTVKLYILLFFYILKALINLCCVLQLTESSFVLKLDFILC